ncbi:Biogenesis of lysosome-related organelles complex 1 subunit VAB2 [Nakaseomyces bracarensis]|uniref:Biogenesis of lysosome-related organelles complex 1 subunit VAB2 n=1 Tax=Nakaseomyces bracarensis TaxID=273131 RepID=A0ABR4NMD8_9SACH
MNILIGSKSRQNLISECDDYKELLNLPNIGNSQELTYKSIFRAVSGEITQVRADIVKVNEHILRDIDEELRQTEKIEKKLKNSFKSINQHYLKLVKHRDHFGTENSSVLLRRFEEQVNRLESNTKSAENNLDMVLKNMVAFDITLPEDERLFGSSTMTKRHYPLLYDLMQEKYGGMYNNDPESIPKGTTTPTNDKKKSSSIKTDTSLIDTINLTHHNNDDTNDEILDEILDENPVKKLDRTNSDGSFAVNVSGTTSNNESPIDNKTIQPQLQEHDKNTIEDTKNNDDIHSSEITTQNSASISSKSSARNPTRILRRLSKPALASTTIQTVNVFAKDSYKPERNGELHI